MKVLISSDMEGTCGVVNFNQIVPPDVARAYGWQGSPDFELARRQGVAEINAAAEGAFAGGATEVVINEAHDGMRNFLPKEMHKEARMITGTVKPLAMVQGIDSTFGAVIFTGYHAAAGTPGAVLAHTMTLSIVEARLNGRLVGEGGFNAAVVGHFGVPVVMVAGDDKVNAELRALLGDQLVGVVTKEGLSALAAKHLHPDKAVALIREGAQKAVANAKNMKPFRVAAPIRLEVDLQTVTLADVCEMIPGVERVGKRTVAYTGKDMLEINREFETICHHRDPFLAP